MTIAGGASGGRLPRLIVAVAARALPDTAVRTRYRQEFAAELGALPRSRQLRYALGVLLRARALRAAVAHPAHRTVPASEVVMVRPPAALLCRLHLHHRWATLINNDGETFRHCRRCGKEPYDPDGSGSNPTAQFFVGGT